MTSILADTYPHIAKLLTDLHALSERQDVEGVGISTLNTQDTASRDFSVFKDKMVALEQDKSELIYTILRQKRATRVFEAAVWGTEKETHKAQCALENLADAFQVSTSSIPNFKLLQGDILEQIADAHIPDDSIDAILFDIWAELALPTFQMLERSLRQDAVIFADNWTTGVQLGTYTAFKRYLEQAGWYFVTLPFKNGLGMAVKGK